MPTNTQEAYGRLDQIHMKSLKDYVYTHIVYKKGDKLKTKKEVIDAFIQIVQEKLVQQRIDNRKQPVSIATQQYASDALDSCKQLMHDTSKYCTPQ